MKYNIGDKVSVRWGGINNNPLNQIGTIIKLEGNDVYVVHFEEFIYITMQFKQADILFSSCYLSLVKPDIKIGEHVVKEANNGVQVGCTFVPDDIIKQIAIIRGLIK